MNIHTTAIVYSTSNIDESNVIGPYTIIGKNVKIGKNNKIGPHVVIEGNTTIGDNNNIFQFASIGSEPQDLKYNSQNTELIIGSHNIIREYVTIQPGAIEGGFTKIGDGNLFMCNSHIAHDCIVGDECWFANSSALAGHVIVENKVIVGGIAGIHQFCRLGSYSFVGAGSIVTMDVAPYSMVQGDRASLFNINTVGLERSGFDQSRIQAIKDSFKSIFYTSGTMSQKIAGIHSKYKDNSDVIYLIDFINNSKRGVTNVKSA